MQGLVLPLKSGVVDASGRLRRSRWTQKFTLFYLKSCFRHWMPVILTYRVVMRVLPTPQVAEQSPHFIKFLTCRGKVPLINN